MSIPIKTTGAEVRLTGLGKRYGQVQAVKPLDLVIEGGTLVTLLGPSGCGKTTLLRMIAGLEQATEGKIFIGGRDVTLLSAGERNVSMVFQSYALFPHMSVLENVAYGLISSGERKQAAHAKAEAVLETVGLKGFGGRLPSEMSGGQQQRVAVARALVLEPDVLLFDEPLSNLDTRLRRTMREEIRALQQRLGLTVVYVTHDQSEALAVSDKIVVMRNAGIAQAGAPEVLYASPDSVFVATFMGEANHVRGVIESVSGEHCVLALDSARLTLPGRGLPPGAVDAVIRPEAIRIAPPDAPNGLDATVTRATYMGSHTEYYFSTAVGELFAQGADRLRRRQPGEKVRLLLEEEGVVVVRP
ncbi:ABC transporter ATP-binding protein [Falsiroseomonas sp.]|uniref:ABC transporter ATP-binding protein n=1 Tax=Falsiroseomonas sp. TaxID=2870721 RepID=UPI003F6E5B9B